MHATIPLLPRPLRPQQGQRRHRPTQSIGRNLPSTDQRCYLLSTMRKTSAPAAAYLYPERVFLPVEVQRLVHVALEAAVVARHVAAQLLPAPVPSLRPQPDRRLLMLLGRCQQPSGHTAE